MYLLRILLFSRNCESAKVRYIFASSIVQVFLLLGHWEKRTFIMSKISTLDSIEHFIVQWFGNALNIATIKFNTKISETEDATNHESVCKIFENHQKIYVYSSANCFDISFNFSCKYYYFHIWCHKGLMLSYLLINS